ncbi:hypothetical protein G9A89_014273 [Geosiphon pyriformis]|nr:hypothetical protein G9A89_014273 [Geosiphon pyriformis]
MELVGFAAGGPGSVSAGLGTRSGVKNKCLVGPQSRGASYKKPKKPVAVDGLVESSAGVSNVMDVSGDGPDIGRLWASKVNSKVDSVSGVSDLDNMENVVAEETSYVESNASGLDDDMDDAMPRKTCTRTFVLNSKPPPLSFNVLNDDKDALPLPSPKFCGSNRLPPVRSRAPEKRSFNSSRLFALNIELSAIPGKTNGDKLISVKKNFYQVDGFGGASTFSKFSGIIRSTFTSEVSMNKTRSLAVSEKILVNDGLKKVNSYTNREIVVKEILVDFPKLAVELVFSKFGKIVFIRMQLVGLWQKALVEFKSAEIVNVVVSKWLVFMNKDFVWVALATEDKQLWVSKNWHWALLYTLSMGTMAHDLSDLLESYDEKTCFIGCNSVSYICNRCVIVCFDDEAIKLAVVSTIPIFKSVSLHWANLVLASCVKCEQFGHIHADCSVGGSFDASSIACPVSFGGKTWAQVASDTPSHAFFSGSSGHNLRSDLVPPSAVSDPLFVSHLNDCLAILEHSLELLADRVSDILVRLESFGVASLVFSSMASTLIVSVALSFEMVSDMIVDNALSSSGGTFLVTDDTVVNLSASGSKIFTAKVGGLKSKILALEALISSVLARLDLLCAGSGLDKGFMGAGVVIVMNNFLAHHVSKVEEIPGRVISVQLLFKSKLLVTVLGLYAGASSGARFGQASEVNSLIAKTVNSSGFVILGGDFNENRSGKSASFKFCLSLGLVNSFVSHYLANSHMWSNLRGVGKTIDHIFVGGNLFSAIAGHQVVSVSDFFDTNHRTVVVSISLDELLDVQLNSLCKQANKDCWKFKIKDADCVGWAKFKDLFSAKLLSLGEVFSDAEMHDDVDAMWAVLVEAVVDSADVTFSRHWFSEFKCSRNKHSSRFFGLELLVAKIVKKFCLGDLLSTDCLVNKWSTLNNVKAHAFKDLVGSGVKSNVVIKHLLLVRRDYKRSKMFESRLAKEASVRKAIEKRMDNFCSDKGNMIRSVLEKPFHKVVLDYLIVDDDLVLLSEEVKLSVDKIMEGWTRKCSVQLELPDLWACQYMPLDHVWDDAFLGVISAINIGKLLSVVGGLSDGKAAGLSGVPNELWKHNDGVLTNTRPIALIETAKKILSKVLSDHISLACSKFNVLRDDNFLVLKGMSTQSPVFAVGSVIEDAIKKDRELWLVLQDMRKAYDSVGLRHVKMCERFIRFFGGIYEDRVNRVMTDFGLSGGYKVHNGLDQGEIKRHKQLCGYQIDTKFVAKSGRIESGGGLTSYFSAGAFVDDTIWVGNCQASTQYALNIANEFFVINDISINSEKMVAISINQGVKVASLSICSQPISIAKKGEAHYVAKAHADVHFFVNVVLRKAITDKQFSYLVSAVLQSIISYCVQFSFDVLVRKSLRSKACLPCDFPDAVLHYPLLYGLKPFEQVQSEGKVAALIMFFNVFGIFGHLFKHRFLDLQVLGWALLDPLQFLVRLRVSPVNNFLAGMMKIFLGNELSLVNNLLTAFRSSGHFPLSFILGKTLYFDSVKSFRHFGVTFGDRLFDKKGVLLDWKTFCCWKRLNLHGPVLNWFLVFFEFLKSQSCLFSGSIDSAEKIGLDILESGEFSVVKDELHNVWLGFFEVFTDEFLRNSGSAEVICGAAAYFPVLDKSIGVAVNGFLLSIMAELQVVTLALECVPSLSTVVLCLDSQAAINVCVSKMSLVAPDFRNQCWLERHYIFNLVRDKDFSVSWVKVKDHSGIPGNVEADLAAGAASGSLFSLCTNVCEHFLVVEGVAISGNAHHFVRNIFWSVCCARWEAGSGCDVVPDAIIGCIDWVVTAKVWHSDSHMLIGFTSQVSLMLRTYIMKAVHRRLPVAVRKKLYDKYYSSVLCLFCSGVEFSDHAFTCAYKSGIRGEILAETSARWSALAGSSSASAVLQVLSQCSFDVGLYTLVCKEFVLEKWYEEACSIFEDRKVAATQIVDYVRFVVELHRAKAWLARASHQVVMEKAGLVCDGNGVFGLFRSVSLVLSDGVVRLFGVANSLLLALVVGSLIVSFLVWVAVYGLL